MNRPKARNAISINFVDQFHLAIEQNQDASCIILTSSTPGMFCAGADLKERKEMSPETLIAFKRKMVQAFNNFENIACPTISVIDGPALGGGCELSMCSDIRVSTSTASLGLPETGLAIIPGAGGTQRLPRLIGVSRAKELIFTGQRLTATEALDIGLVNHVRKDYAEAMEKALEMANIIGGEKGPVAIRAAK